MNVENEIKNQIYRLYNIKLNKYKGQNLTDKFKEILYREASYEIGLMLSGNSPVTYTVEKRGNFNV